MDDEANFLLMSEKGEVHLIQDSSCTIKQNKAFLGSEPLKKQYCFNTSLSLFLSKTGLDDLLNKVFVF